MIFFQKENTEYPADHARLTSYSSRAAIAHQETGSRNHPYARIGTVLEVIEIIGKRS